jgi:acyl-CoA thioester hydrolase
MKTIFSIQRRVCFYETDAMGVVHHSNYLRFFEEARMHWYNDRNFRKYDGDDPDRPETPRINYAVVNATANYHAPARYNDELVVRVQVKADGNKLRFEYVIEKIDGKKLVSGYTLHVPVDNQMKVCRLSPSALAALKEEPWIETLL